MISLLCFDKWAVRVLTVHSEEALISYQNGTQLSETKSRLFVTESIFPLVPL